MLKGTYDAEHLSTNQQKWVPNSNLHMGLKTSLVVVLGNGGASQHYSCYHCIVLVQMLLKREKCQQHFLSHSFTVSCFLFNFDTWILIIICYIIKIIRYFVIAAQPHGNHTSSNSPKFEYSHLQFKKKKLLQHNWSLSFLKSDHLVPKLIKC